MRIAGSPRFFLQFVGSGAILLPEETTLWIQSQS
jgi:hypothetical protein